MRERDGGGGGEGEGLTWWGSLNCPHAGGLLPEYITGLSENEKQEENNIAGEPGINKHTTQYMIAHIGILHGLSAIYIDACKVLAKIYFIVFVPIAKKRIKQHRQESGKDYHITRESKQNKSADTSYTQTTNSN